KRLSEPLGLPDLAAQQNTLKKQLAKPFNQLYLHRDHVALLIASALLIYLNIEKYLEFDLSTCATTDPEELKYCANENFGKQSAFGFTTGFSAAFASVTTLFLMWKLAETIFSFAKKTCHNINSFFHHHENPPDEETALLRRGN